MTWYQTFSLLAALYFSWQLLVPLYRMVNGQGFTISLVERLFFTGLFMNLALAFLGEPW